MEELTKFRTTSKPHFLCFKGGAGSQKSACVQRSCPVRGAFESLKRISHGPFLRLTGEQLEIVEGVNTPALQKMVAEHIPEGMIDTGAEAAAAGRKEEAENK